MGAGGENDEGDGQQDEAGLSTEELLELTHKLYELRQLRDDARANEALARQAAGAAQRDFQGFINSTDGLRLAEEVRSIQAAILEGKVPPTPQH